MRTYHIKVNNPKKDICPAPLQVQATNPAGETLSFTNYYAEKNGRPFFGICGEFHFSRYRKEQWEDEIIKMKLAGVNIIPTYVFWNHHEEVQGSFEWEGNKNLRHFVELCAEHQIFVILRIGPFAHGEARNGGIPDWLFGRPFELRANNEQYLRYVEVFYREIANQINGLLFKEGGPIIGAQIENEYGHAGAPWELTTGTAQEWVPAGSGGADHMKALKELAQSVGIHTPLYTATGWGGASAPSDDVLPLWGGYAFWPWIFYDDVKEHPATQEYIFRDFHNNESSIEGYTPAYLPESLPYACCEMGGGMTVFYQYRFKLPYESVDALAAVKVAGGCNFVGYYVFHGGSNPKGKRTPFLNETATPKISYDYQAPIGEFGQLRDSYKRLKRQHYFYKDREATFSLMKTILPEGAEQLEPTDVDTLRYAVRADGDAGYIFMNNYQDHVETKDKKDFSIAVDLKEETVTFPRKGGLSLAKDEACILPFNLNLGGCLLKSATTQYMCSLQHEDETYYFFFSPKKMKGEYAISAAGLAAVETDRGEVEKAGNEWLVTTDSKPCHLTQLTLTSGKKLYLCTLTHEESLDFWQCSIKGKQIVLLTNSALLIDEERIRFECEDISNLSVSSFPALDNILSDSALAEKRSKRKGLFQEYDFSQEQQPVDFEIHWVSDAKADIRILAHAFRGAKELLLSVEYEGDIGYAFIDGELIHDNFCNNATWQIGLKSHETAIVEKGMYLYISPLKTDSYVKTDSPMAARTEVVNKQVAKIHSINITAVKEIAIPF
ncbi:Glycosyl hydrolases family 35 [Evansella caseinilytica]|uniref:Beta-galactosidase n=1 Tax=Evansella caseinilytica TaxID=1503961 RepID=A0A1H3I1J7_9BACI|nr:beta-galactosidase [Evansella caseinilytica]SDY21492.1 Glycosyl hydrolases family 35 [Evansella caseinilytica]